MMSRKRIILAAHGSGDGSVANRQACAWASLVSASRPDTDVVAAFQLGMPRFRDAVEGVAEGEALVVPLLTSAGYFLRQVLPEQFGSACSIRGRGPRVTTPIGSLRSIRAEFVAAVAELARQASDDVTVIVVGHGTTRNAASGAATREVAGLIGRAIPRALVLAAFLDEAPSVEEVACIVATGDVIVAPWLIGGGHHAREDVGRRLAGLRPGTRTHTGPTLGELPGFVAAIHTLIDWHSPEREYRIGTRSSPLARRQAEIVWAALAATGVRTSVVEVSTIGDRDRERAIDAFETDGPFTDELEVAVANGDIDLAVHSLKDLPLDRGDIGKLTAIAAVLERAPAGEVLVSRGGLLLAELAPGARVGTSSRRRAAQLRAIRPDLVPVPMRGPVDQRILQVLSDGPGALDAAILAEAGLVRLGASSVIAERLSIDAFVPDPGQGALAVTARADDHHAGELAASIGHEPTRRAVTAEREAARLIEADGTVLVAAYAEVMGDAAEMVRLRVRAVDRVTGEFRDVEVHSHDPCDAACEAAAVVMAQRGEVLV